MHVTHDRAARTAEIVLDKGEPVTIHDVSQHQIVAALWERHLVLGPTSHWLPIGNRHRHGIDHAAIREESA